MIDPDIIGREDELAQLVGVLERGKPGVVVVAGEVGVGRHALVLEACSRASGWNLLPDGDARLYVEPRTTAEGFARRLLEALADDGASDEGRDEAQVKPPAPADVEVLADRLAQRAPAVLLLERYRPERRLDRWLADVFLRGVRERGAPIVLALLDIPDGETKLAAAADAHITLGPLTIDAVRPVVAEIGGLAIPPVEADELEVYASAIAARPGIFDSLVRLLGVELETAHDTQAARS